MARLAPPPQRRLPPIPYASAAHGLLPLPLPPQPAYPASREVCVRLGADGSAVVFDAEEADAAERGDGAGPYSTVSVGEALFEMRIRGAGVTVTSLRYNPRVAAAAQLAASAGAPAAALLRAAAAVAPPRAVAPAWFAAATGGAAPTPPAPLSPHIPHISHAQAAAAQHAHAAAAAAAAYEDAAAAAAGTAQRRTRRVRALFDDAHGGRDAHAQWDADDSDEEDAYAYAQQQQQQHAYARRGAQQPQQQQRLDLSSHALLRTLRAGHLGDALAAAASPVARPKPRSLPA
jgi:hypothetical protein